MLVFILPNFSNAATLFLSPSSGNYNSGGQMSVSVRINTESEAINAVDGTIGFNPDILEVSSVTKGTAVSLWVQEPSYSNKAGNVNFGGVILNPGYYGSNGNILTINFRAKGSGKAEISFKAGSVLANDGYGTNVLKTLGTASFVRVDNFVYTKQSIESALKRLDEGGLLTISFAKVKQDTVKKIEVL